MKQIQLKRDVIIHEPPRKPLMTPVLNIVSPETREAMFRLYLKLGGK